MSNAEGLAARRLDKAPGKRLPRGERHGMLQDVEAAPVVLEALKCGIDFGVAGHVEGDNDGGPQALGERLHALLQLVVKVGEGERGAFAMHRLRDAPGNGAVGGDANDERALAGEKAHQEWRFMIRMMSF